MVIASDGIWDALSKSELLNILMRGDEIDLNKTCNDIIEE
jgi:serine/threonine protein phosphatase PrpC